MFYPDIQYIDDQHQQIALVDNGSAVNQASSGDFKVGVCRPIPNVAGMHVGLDQSLTPVGDLVNYLWQFDSNLSKLSEANRRRALDSLEKSAVVSLVEGPKYGVLTKTVDLLGNNPEKGLDFYIPRSGDMRKDRVSYVVEMGEYRVKVVYSIIPVNDGVVSEETVRQLCGRKGEYYRIAAEVAVDTGISAEGLLKFVEPWPCAIPQPSEAFHSSKEMSCWITLA